MTRAPSLNNAAQGGFLLSESLAYSLNIYDGYCYYQNAVGGLYATDGKECTEVLPDGEIGLLDVACVSEYGILYLRGKNDLGEKAEIWLASWTGSGVGSATGTSGSV